MLDAARRSEFLAHSSFVDSDDIVEDSSRKKSRKFIAFLGISVIGFAVLATMFLVHDYRRTIEEARQNIQQDADILALRITALLDSTNIEMQSVIDDLHDSGIKTSGVLALYNADRLARVPQQIEAIDALVVLSPDGKVQHPLGPEFAALDLSDRRYFQQAIQARPGEYIVGEPIISRVSGEKLTPIAWPFHTDDEVRLVLASRLGEAQFQRMFDETVKEPLGSVSILTDRGAVAFTNDPEGAPEARMLEVSTRIGDHDLQVQIAIPESAALSPYYKRVNSFGLLTALIFGVVLFLAVYGHNQARALDRSLSRTRREMVRSAMSEMKFNLILENVADGIVVGSDDGSLARANNRARSLLGVESSSEAVQAIMSRKPAELEVGSDGTLEFSFAIRSRRQAEPAQIRCRISEIDTFEGKAFFCVLSDVTVEKRLISARQAFVTSVNHELRTPLTSLKGAVEILDARYKHMLDGPAPQLVEMARRNAERLLNIVNDILTIQAVDENRLHISLESAAIGPMIAESAQANAAYGEPSRVRIETAIADEPLQIMVDPLRFHQIMNNLISNAIKYSPKGGVVEVGCKRVSDTAIVWVRDKGPGIPEEAHKKIFERFSSPVHSSKNQASGTGLGLAITKELVERQQGKISLSSVVRIEESEDHGTTFQVEFPLVDPGQQVVWTREFRSAA